MTMTATLPPEVQSNAIYKQTVHELTGMDASAAEQAVITGQVPREIDLDMIIDRTLHYFEIKSTKRRISEFWKGQRTPAERLDYVLATARVMAQVQPVLGETAARQWLQEPNKHLADQTPLVLLRTTTGGKRVQGLINSMLNGYYP